MKIRKEVNNMSDFEVIATYTQDQAIEDGILVKLCEIRWNGTIKPYIATTHIYGDIGLDGAMEIWKEFVDWRVHVMPTLPEEEQLFCTGLDERKVWIIEDGAAFTIMYPEDY
jgi:hypothetical protein